MNSAAERGRLYRRTLWVLVLAQVLAGAGLAAGVTVGALLAEDMLGGTGFSGVPIALFAVGSATAALLIGVVSQSRGRRLGLVAGYGIGAVGGGLVVVAAAIDSVPLLLVALLVYGAGTAAGLQARYAGTDLAPPDHRARAVSTVLVATTIGAVGGPLVAAATGRWAESVGLPELSGPFVLAAIAYAAASVALLILMRPDPLLAAREMEPVEEMPAVESPEGTEVTRAAVTGTRGIVIASAAMVATQIAMVAVMTMTPIHMRDHGHGLGAAGAVIAVHVAFMFLPSPLTGWLTDRLGRMPILAAAGVTLLLAGIVAGTAPADSVFILGIGLALLGLGWNFGLVAGSALLTDSVPADRRAKAQGSVDLGVALAGAGAALTGGIVVAGTDYATLAIASGMLALLLLPLMVVVARGRPSSAR